MFYLTSHDSKTVRLSHEGYDSSDRYFDQEHFETNPYDFRLKSYGSNSGFHVLVILTLTVVLFFVTCTGQDVLESPCKTS